MPHPVRIAKNTSFFTIALIVQKVLSFGYFAYVARAIGEVDLGKYVFALSFTTIFAIFIDVGLAPVLARETARDAKNTQKYFSSILGLKIPLAVFVYLVCILTINLLGYPELTKTLVYLAGLTMLLDSFVLTFYHVFRGQHNLKWESIGTILFQVLLVGFGLVALYMGYGIIMLILAYFFASIFNILFAVIMLKLKLQVSFRPRFDTKILKLLLKISIPFAMINIFARVYSYMDTVLLSKLAGDQAVGWYSIPFKLTFALQFVPMAFTASLFPAMSSFFSKGDKKMLAKAFERACQYLMIVAVPISVAVVILAGKLVNTVWPEFQESILPLQILISALIFIFLGFPTGSMLNACNKQVISSINLGIVMVISIVMNIFLIPRFDVLGVTITAFVTNTLLFLLGLYWVEKIVRYDKKFLWLTFIKIMFAALIMGGFVYTLRDSMNFLALGFLGAFVYFVLLYVLRGYSKKDVVNILASLVRR